MVRHPPATVTDEKQAGPHLARALCPIHGLPPEDVHPEEEQRAACADRGPEAFVPRGLDGRRSGTGWGFALAEAAPRPAVAPGSVDPDALYGPVPPERPPSAASAAVSASGTRSTLGRSSQPWRPVPRSRNRDKTPHPPRGARRASWSMTTPARTPWREPRSFPAELRLPRGGAGAGSAAIVFPSRGAALARARRSQRHGTPRSLR